MYLLSMIVKIASMYVPDKAGFEVQFLKKK